MCCIMIYFKINFLKFLYLNSNTEFVKKILLFAYKCVLVIIDIYFFSDTLG